MLVRTCWQSLVLTAVVAGSPPVGTSSLRASSKAPLPAIEQVARPSTEAEEVKRLHHQIREERGLTKILDYAAQVAQKNATVQEDRQRALEAELLALAGPNHAKVNAAERRAQQVREGNLHLEKHIKDADERITRNQAEVVALEAASASDVFDEGSDSSMPSSSLAAVKGWMACMQWLRDCQPQLAVAIVVGLIGLSSVYNSAIFFQALVVGIVAFLSGVAGATQVQASWEDKLPLWMEIVVGIEAAVIAGVATRLGFAGFRTMSGSLVGALIAKLGTEKGAIRNHPDMEPIWCAVCVAIGAAAFSYAGPKGADAVFGSVAGGLLVASCFAFVTESMVGEATNWLDFTASLVSAGSDGDKDHKIRHVTLAVGASAGLVVALWAALRAMGVFPKKKKPDVQDGKAVAPGPYVAAQPGQLRQPLLEPRGPGTSLNQAAAAGLASAYLTPARGPTSAPLPSSARGHASASDGLATAQRAMGRVKQEAQERFSNLAASPAAKTVGGAMQHTASGNSALSGSSRVPPPPAPPRSVQPSRPSFPTQPRSSRPGGR